MNADSEELLGWISPDMPITEKSILEYAFGMRMGWEDDESRFECREDGQPFGGSGRFSGVLVEGDEGDAREVLLWDKQGDAREVIVENEQGDAREVLNFIHG